MPTTSPENNLELIIGAVFGSRKSSLIVLDSESAALRIIGEDETELKTVNNSCDDIEAETMVTSVLCHIIEATVGKYTSFN